MCYSKTDASKVAFYLLVQFAIKHNFTFIDAQQETDHLASLGAKTIPLNDFSELLAESLKKKLCRGSGRG